jgi:DNA-binding GntR family transcriptional regulator
MLPSGHTLSDTESDRAYRQLREAILRGELAPGQALVEADLMRALSVGRTPLREAVRTLVLDGLVEVITRRGTYVTQVDISDCANLLSIRAAVERVLAGSAVANASAVQVKELGDFIDRAESDHGVTLDDLTVDTGFHDRMLAMSGNPYLTPIYWRFVGESMRLLSAVGATYEPVADLVPEFRRAQRALAESDAGGLEDALLDHVRSFERRFAEALLRLPASIRSAASSQRLATSYAERYGER